MTEQNYASREKKGKDSTNAEEKDFVLSKEPFFASPLQKKCLFHVAALESVQHGIKTPKIRFLSELSDEERKMYGFEVCSDYGSYYNEIDSIVFNDYPGVHSNMMEALDTIIHETRHKYQYCLMDRSDKNSVRAYLQYGDATYPTDETINTERGKKAYQENAFEKDAYDYTEGRIAYYAIFKSCEIVNMGTLPGKAIHSQILMQPGDFSPEGKSSPLVTSDEFELFTGYDIQGKDGLRMGNTGINYSPEAQKEAIDFYKSGIEYVQSESKKMIENLKDSIQQHPYAELERSINVIIDYYNDELPGVIKGMIEAWTTSDSCFSKALERHNEKGESFDAAKRLERDLEGSVDEMFQDIEEVNVSLAANSDPDQVSQAASRVNTYAQSIGDQARNYKNQCDQRADQNQLYQNLKPMVEATWDYVVKTFEALRDDIGKVSSEFASAIEANKRASTTPINRNNNGPIDSAKVSTGRNAKRNR